MAAVLVLSFSDIARDPRVSRQVAALRTQHEVTVAAFGAARGQADRLVELPPVSAQLPGRLAQSLANLARRPLGRFDEIYWRDSRFREWRDQLRGLGSDVVVANDAMGLPLAFESAEGAPVVFDAHEHAPTEHEQSLRWRLLVRPVVRSICAEYVPRTAAMTAVSPSIARLYARDYGVAPVVVRNVPSYQELEPQPPGEYIRLIHFGGADRSRRIERMIDVMRRLDERFTLDLLLVGNGRYVRQLQRRARDLTAVRFLSPVPMDEIVTFGNEYDVGLYLLPPTHANQTFALPNKFFEFIQARLAVAIGPSPEMAALVQEYGVGIVAEDFEVETMARVLAALTSEELSSYKRASAAAAVELSAERELPRMLEVVERALGHG
jgi:hypothetical protein